jgi:hypothetical protein
MDIQEEMNSELLRLDVPFTSLGAFQLDASQERQVVRVDYEGVTGTFDPQDLLSLLKILPDRAGSIVIVEAIRLSRERR